MSLRSEWLQALRSGKYRQGRSNLRNHDNTFCCLGVLCDIKNPKGWSLDNGDFLHEDGKWAGTFIGEKLLKEVGLFAVQASDLADMNDAGVGFEDIAKHIEEFFDANDKFDANTISKENERANN